MGGTSSVGGQGAAAGYDTTMGGVIGGVEYANRVSNTVFGIAGGYSASQVTVSDGRASIDSGHLGIYGGFTQNELTLTGALAYHRGGVDLSRTITFGGGGGAVATGATSMQAEAYYDLGSAMGEGWSFGPVASLHAVGAHRDAYSETGAGILNLQVSADAVSRIDGTVGLRIGGQFEIGDVVVTPQAELRYERQLSNTSGTGQAAITLAGANFAPQVATGAVDQIGVGLSLGVEFAPNFSIKASYDGAFGEGVQSHQGLASMLFRF